MGDHSHINNGTHRLPHIWPFIFTPYMSPKPLFLPKIVFTLSRIMEIFHSKTPNQLEFEKKVPKCPQFLWRLSLKDPLNMVCLRGMLLTQTQSEAGKVCILETESCNLVNTFRCKFNKGDENKFQFYRLNRPNCALWMNFIGGQGWYRLLSPLVEHGRGYILQPPSINLHT